MSLSISSGPMRIDASTRALVTGASSGIGLALARALVARGAAVGLLSRSAGDHDLVVPNAGIAHYGPFLHQDVELVEAMTRVNWLGTVYTVKAALGHLVDRAG